MAAMKTEKDLVAGKVVENMRWLDLEMKVGRED